MAASAIMQIYICVQTKCKAIGFDRNSRYLHEYSTSFRSNSGRQCSLKAATLLSSVFALFILTPPTPQY